MRVCVVCGEQNADRAHIKSKGSGGSLDECNIMHLCREHHSVSHGIGWKKFSEIYPKVLRELKAKGWEFNLVFGVWKLTHNKGENDVGSIEK